MNPLTDSIARLFILIFIVLLFPQPTWMLQRQIRRTGGVGIVSSAVKLNFSVEMEKNLAQKNILRRDSRMRLNALIWDEAHVHTWIFTYIHADNPCKPEIPHHCRRAMLSLTFHKSLTVSIQRRL